MSNNTSTHVVDQMMVWRELTKFSGKKMDFRTLSSVYDETFVHFDVEIMNITLNSVVGKIREILE